jgi:hypothetical protein
LQHRSWNHCSVLQVSQSELPHRGHWAAVMVRFRIQESHLN